MATGLGGMVWRLRNWQGGNPVAQAAQCQDLGLSWVSLKIVDGTMERWEGSLANQNADLLPATVAALRGAGVNVTGWGWTYGRTRISPYPSIAIAEAQATIRIMAKHGMTEFLVDAETDYKRTTLNMAAEAQKYCIALRDGGPSHRYYLCSYRYSAQHATFPWNSFLGHMDGHAPQVYFLQDTRPDGGALQLRESYRQLQNLKPLPFLPIAPTYASGSWRATKTQLTLMFTEARALGCEGVGVWALEMASTDQLSALREFDLGLTILTIEEKVARLWEAHPELHKAL